MPASGPAKSGTLSATTGSPVSAKRAGSPLALMMTPFALRADASEHTLQNGHAADRDARLVAAAHAARQTAGEHKPESRRNGHARCT